MSTHDIQEEGDKLLRACQEGEFDRAYDLVSSGTSIDFHDENGHTPAIVCCFCGHGNILQFIIDQGGDLNRARNDGSTPLLAAVASNSLECMSLLLQHGADSRKTDNLGATAVIISAAHNHSDSAQRC